MSHRVIVFAVACVALGGAGASDLRLPAAGMIVDLNADVGVDAAANGRVVTWRNQVGGRVKEFRATRQDGKPTWKKGAASGV